MTFYSLPTTTENFFAAYIAANYSGVYPIFNAFSAENMTFPAIVVEASEFRQLNYETHQFKGTAEVSIVTQIDDVESPLLQHDNTVAEVYIPLADKVTLIAAANVSGNNLHLFDSDIVAVRQRREEAARCFVTTLELEVFGQTLEF